MASKNQVVKTDNKSKSVSTESAVPDFMKGKKGGIADNFTSADIEIPRLLLLQMVSPEVEEGFGKPGEFFHNVAETNLGTDLNLTIIYAWKSYILWRPRKDGGGILARALDGVHWSPPDTEFRVKLDNKKEVVWKTAETVEKSGLAEWGSSDPEDKSSQPAATAMINLLVSIEGHEEISPIIITLQRGSYKVGKKLLGKLRMSSVPTYGMRFALGAEKDQNSTGDEFWTFKFSQIGFVQDPEVYAKYESLYNSFADKTITVVDEASLDRSDADGDGGDSGDTEKVKSRVS